MQEGGSKETEGRLGEPHSKTEERSALVPSGSGLRREPTLWIL